MKTFSQSLLCGSNLSFALTSQMAKYPLGNMRRPLGSEVISHPQGFSMCHWVFARCKFRTLKLLSYRTKDSSSTNPPSYIKILESDQFKDCKSSYDAYCLWSPVSTSLTVKQHVTLCQEASHPHTQQRFHPEPGWFNQEPIRIYPAPSVSGKPWCSDLGAHAL